MFGDTHTEVETKGVVTRLKESITSVLFGIALIIAAIFLIWWNEGMSIDRIKTLDAGRGMIVPLSSGDINPANDG